MGAGEKGKRIKMHKSEYLKRYNITSVKRLYSLT